MHTAASTCEYCRRTFELTETDRQFYDRLDVPPPRLCPSDRQRRRAAFRNERNLYVRSCDGTGKRIVSMYSPDKPFKVFDQEYFWSDAWDGIQYGREFDLHRPFFEQFRELQLSVPRLSLFNVQSENSYYTNHSAYNKNCYLGVDLGKCEDVLYSNWMTNSKDCVDCSYSDYCELCYFVLYCVHCYNCDFCTDCEQCRDCYYCYDCHNCENCFGCTGLRGKRYYLHNKFVGREAFEAHLEDRQFSYLKQQEDWQQFKAIRQTVPHRFASLIQCEDCSGDHLHQCKNAHYAFDSVRLWDCKYMYECDECKDAYDCYQPGLVEAELIYEIHAGQGQKQSRFMNVCRQVNECNYCDYCFESSHLFGCVGLRRKQFCILNKQYPEKQYHETVQKLIAHLRSTREWGEFFPFWCSPFGYNESKAQDFFPITKEEAVQKNIPWSSYEAPIPDGAQTRPEDDIRAISDHIFEKVIKCEETGHLFRIISAELGFYRRKNLPIPLYSSEVRYRYRMALRNPQQLWKRSCSRCEVTFQTSYAPSRTEQILCESCYYADRYGEGEVS